MSIFPTGSAGAIPNGSVINGVANFWQTTPPALRVDSSALVAGDSWYKPTDNGVVGTAGYWIWTGSDWATSYAVPYETNKSQSATIGAVTEGLRWGGQTDSDYSKGPLFAFNSPTPRLYLESVILRGYGTVGSSLVDGSNNFNLYAEVMGIETLIGAMASLEDMFGSYGGGLSHREKNHSIKAVLLAGNSGFSVSLKSREVVGSPTLQSHRFFWTFVFRGLHP